MYVIINTSGTTNLVFDANQYETNLNAVLLEADLVAAGGNATVALPAISTMLVSGGPQSTMRINGSIKTTSGVRSLTLEAAMGDTICGDASFTITGQYTCFSLTVAGTNTWLASICTPGTQS